MADFDDQEVDFPDSVKSFSVRLTNALRNASSFDVQTLYEQDYVEITDRHYKQKSWPEASEVGPLVDDDENFLVLYKELFFRHVYANLSPTLADRIYSFQNYIDLFDIILGLNTGNPEFEIPAVWLWDMIDEFIYQFQSFHQYRTEVRSLSEEEKEELREREHVWSAQTVIRYLHALVKQSGFSIQHSLRGEAKQPDQVHSQFQTLGQFSLIGLLRINCLLGDYTAAMQALAPIDLRNKRSVLFEIMASHATLYYYLGFAYLMTRRYTDAIKTLSSFMVYASRNKNSLPRSYQRDMIAKKTGQMHGLMAIALSISPQYVDENLLSAIREKYGDSYNRMQVWDISAFEDVFNRCCPKFVTLAAPDYDEGENSHKDGLELQRKIFVLELQQRARVPQIVDHLKLCTSVDMPKLARFLDCDEDSAAEQLLCLKHKTRQVRWQDGPASSGELRTIANVHFYVNKGLVHMTEQRRPQKYGEFFIRNLLKMEDLAQDVSRIGNPY